MKFKRRFRYNKKRVFIYMFFIMLLSTLTLGYSLLTTTLEIEGVGKISKAVWNIHFANIQTKQGSVTPVQAPTISNDTNITFNVKLAEPTNFYEFTADIVNEGTIDAKINSFTILPVLTEAQKKYFNYTVTYSDGTEIKVNDALNANTTEKIKVRFEYLEQTDTSLYPTEDQEFSLQVGIDYVQGKGNEVEHSKLETILSGKKIIILGERDCVSGLAIQEAIETTGAEVVYADTAVYTETAAAAMDLQVQQSIKSLAEQYGTENIVVILGIGDEGWLEITGETVTTGDPTFAGPLTEIQLHLPVYHIFEDEIKNLVDPTTYEEQIYMMEWVMQEDGMLEIIKNATRRIRETGSIIS